jgi:lipid II:glycine glycyltransferase (peptidoglycan interpeptide bridge formation enzyme)
LFRSEKSLKKLLQPLAEYGRKERAIFLRMSPYREWPDFRRSSGSPRLKPAFHDTQPETSLVLDLTQTEQTLLDQMKPKGRYNIRVAQKHGIQVKPSKDASVFHALLKKTGVRDGFGIHPEAYYRKMLTSLEDRAMLLLAYHKGEPIAGGIFIFTPETAIYYYGASDHEKRPLMAPYLVQWKAILEAKKRGCKTYDFLGIAPENAKNHPWEGVTRFKKQFGGKTVEFPGATDMILRPCLYWLFKCYKTRKLSIS